MSSWWTSRTPSTSEEADSEGIQTRRQAAATRASASEPVAQTIRGWDFYQVERLEQRVRSRLRGATPPASPELSHGSAATADASSTTSTSNLNRPPTMDEDTASLLTLSNMHSRDREESNWQSTMATEATVKAALANQTAQVQALRKPDLPPFDKEEQNSRERLHPVKRQLKQQIRFHEKTVSDKR